MPGLLGLSWDDGLNALVAEGIETIVFRTVNDQPTLWEFHPAVGVVGVAR
jgi:IS5 family transposase